MLQNNCDPGLSQNSGSAMDRLCPHCGSDMEKIDSGRERVLHDLQLCPGCYLVTWTDIAGIHMRQGIPAAQDGRPPAAARQWFVGDPKPC